MKVNRVELEKVYTPVRVKFVDFDNDEFGVSGNPIYVTGTGDLGEVTVDVSTLPDTAATAANQALLQTLLGTTNTNLDTVNTNLTSIGSTLDNSYTELVSIGSTLDAGITVEATDFDIRALDSSTDSVSIEGGNSTDVKITLDSETVDVTATDLDIRDLSYAQDSVEIIDGDGDSLDFNSDGTIRESSTGNTITGTTQEMTLADTEYSVDLGSNVTGYEFWCREDEDIRFAFASGKVAGPTDPYFTLKAGESYYVENLDSSEVLYFACSKTGKTVEVIYRSRT